MNQPPHLYVLEWKKMHIVCGHPSHNGNPYILGIWLPISRLMTTSQYIIWETNLSLETLGIHILRYILFHRPTPEFYKGFQSRSQQRHFRWWLKQGGLRFITKMAMHLCVPDWASPLDAGSTLPTINTTDMAYNWPCSQLDKSEWLRNVQQYGMAFNVVPPVLLVALGKNPLTSSI